MKDITQLPRKLEAATEGHSVSAQSDRPARTSHAFGKASVVTFRSMIRLHLKNSHLLVKRQEEYNKM